MVADTNKPFEVQVQGTAPLVDVLLVEDNPGDARLVQEALAENNLELNLHIVRDGMQALAFVNQEGEYADAPTPDLVLLDFNLPMRDGREVLANIKNDPVLKRLPVVILSSSEAEQDILQSYDLHANCYIQKPLDFEQFTTVIKSVGNFWFNIVKLPKRHE